MFRGIWYLHLHLQLYEEKGMKEVEEDRKERRGEGVRKEKRIPENK
jgi:hypothetical protein